MSVDLSKFLGLFFEESHADLERLEFSIDFCHKNSCCEKELAMAIRASHSIKGNSGAFGFEDVLRVMQSVENVLATATQKKINIDSECFLTILFAIKCTKKMLSAHQNGGGYRDMDAEDLCSRLDSFVPTNAPIDVCAR